MDKAQLHIPQFLLCLGDEVVTLDKKISMKLRGIQLFNFVRILILSEKNIATITTVFVSFFQLLFSETMIGLQLTEVIVSFVS